MGHDLNDIENNIFDYHLFLNFELSFNFHQWGFGVLGSLGLFGGVLMSI